MTDSIRVPPLDIYAERFGAIGAVAAINTATLMLAIAEASDHNGARVIVPEGNIPITALTIPPDVVIKGASA